MALIELILTVVAWLTPAIVDAYIVSAIASISVIFRRHLLLLQDDFFFAAVIAAGILPSSSGDARWANPLVVWFQHDCSESNLATILLF